MNSYLRLSGFQSSLLLIHFRYGPNTCSSVAIVTHHFADRFGTAALRYGNRVEITDHMCEQTEWLKSSTVFVPTQELSGI